MAAVSVPDQTDKSEIRDRTRETRCRFPGDDFLREFGFAICSRPRGGPAVWTRNGITFTQEEAIEYAKRLKKQSVERLEAIGK